jgi:hypothetical protein
MSRIPTALKVALSHGPAVRTPKTKSFLEEQVRFLLIASELAAIKKDFWETYEYLYLALTIAEREIKDRALAQKIRSVIRDLNLRCKK